MSKTVMISIRPKWCEKIASGEKTIEVRKTRPKLETPFKCYIYCTKDKHLAFMQNDSGTNLIACMNAETAIPVGGFLGNGKVIGEFTCDTYVTDKTFGHDPLFNAAACMSEDEAVDYANGSPLYGWHISDLVIYDEPKILGEFRRVCVNDLYCESCAMYRNNGGNCGNESLHLKRPFQSWGYVEEL